MMSDAKGKRSSSTRGERKSTKTRPRSGAAVRGPSGGRKRLRGVTRPPLDSFDQFNRVRRSKKVLTWLTLPKQDQQTLLDADAAWAKFDKIYQAFLKSGDIVGKTLPQAVWDELDTCKTGMETLSLAYPKVRKLKTEVGEIKQMQENLREWEQVLQQDVDTLAKKGAQLEVERLLAQTGDAAAASATVTPVFSAEEGAAVLAELAASPTRDEAHP